MNGKDHRSSFEFCLEELRNQRVIAYPTESIFGLGCDPDSKSAVMMLLKLKKRPIEKGLILVAANFNQLKPYIALSKLSSFQKKKIMYSFLYDPITFIVPVSLRVPFWLTGTFHSLAIRVISHPDVKRLCLAFGKPLVSTSANLSKNPPCRTVDELLRQFGNTFPFLLGRRGWRDNPSEIQDIMTGKVIRSG